LNRACTLDLPTKRDDSAFHADVERIRVEAEAVREHLHHVRTNIFRRTLEHLDDVRAATMPTMRPFLTIGM
jgi:hypothetical protein